MIEILDTFTTRGSGVRSQVLRARGRIGLHVRFRSTGLPPSTLVRAYFVAEYVEQITQAQLGAYRPWYIVSGDLTINNDTYQAGLEWDLPDSDPIPTRNLSVSEAEQLVRETWRMRSWGGTWEFKAIMGFITPGVGEGALAFSPDRWIYTIRY